MLYYNHKEKRKGDKKMTVKELMEWLATQDENGKIVLCDWEDEVAVRVFSNKRMKQLKWETKEED